MKPLTFEEQLNSDIEKLCRRFSLSIEILVTRWGKPSDDWVSWDVDMIIAPERMDAYALLLYGELGRLLKHDPYRIMEEGITPDRIGYMVVAKQSGQHKQAVLKPDLSEAYYNLGVALQAKGLLEEALAAYQQAVKLKPYPTTAK